MNFASKFAQSRLSFRVTIAAFAYIPFHVFIAQSLSLLTGGIEYWKLGKDAILLGYFGVFFCGYLISRHYSLLKLRIFQVAVVYLLITFLYFFMHNNPFRAEALGLLYSSRLVITILFGLTLGTLIQKKQSIALKTTLLFAGIIVVIFGIVQVLALPDTLLRSFGYSTERGTPEFSYIGEVGTTERAFSTLKDPNTLGVFLLFFVFLLLNAKNNKIIKGGVFYPLVVLTSFCLYLTYSRSAIVGLMVAAAAHTILTHRKHLFKRLRALSIAAVLLLIVGGGMVITNLDSARQAFIRSGEQSLSTSDTIRIESYKQAIHLIKEAPLGYGPGSAGPASVRNDKISLLPENYLLQIAVEYGVLGAILLVAFFVQVGAALWKSQNKEFFAAYIGVQTANLFVPTWNNEIAVYVIGLLLGLSAAQSGTTKSLATRSLSANSKANKRKNHIVIDARIRTSSTGRPVARLLERLQTIDQHNHYTVILAADDNWKPRANNISVKFTRYPLYSFNVLHQLFYAVEIYRLRPSLVYFTLSPQQPLFYIGKQITMTHDLTMLCHATRGSLPRWLHIIRMAGYRLLLWAAHRKASLVIVPTEYVSKDIINKYRFLKNKVLVIHEAGDIPKETPVITPEKAEKEFILYVGNTFPFKNVDRMISAFELLKEKHQNLKLVIVGRRDYYLARLEADAAKFTSPGAIVFTGRIPDEELIWYYENAKAYVFPSLSEGFGLPGLEAMAHGCPVVSSNATCLPEVHGDAAHYFDPEDVQDMAQKIDDVITNEDLRKKLIKKGYQNVKRFSWESFAEKHLTLFDQLLKQRRS